MNSLLSKAQNNNEDNNNEIKHNSYKYNVSLAFVQLYLESIQDLLDIESKDIRIFKNLLKGEYGKLPGEPNEEIVKKVVGDEKIITCRPADLIPPEYDKFKGEMSEYYTSEEDVLSYAMFNEVAINFFKWRLANKSGIDKELAEKTNGVYPV